MRGPTLPRGRLLCATLLSAQLLSGCALVSLTATVAETAVSAAGTVVTTTGKVIGGAVDAVTPSRSDSNSKPDKGDKNP